MARNPGLSLNKSEKIAGFCYLPFYLVLLSLLIHFCTSMLGIALSDLALNLCYYSINFLFILIVYRHFLARSFRSIRFWDLVQAVILGFVMYYAGSFLLGLLLSLLKIQPTSYNDQAIAGLVQANRWVMPVCTIVIAPPVEELLLRGVVFGTIRRKNRIVAYIISVLLFSMMHVWQYIPQHGLLPVLSASLLYLVPSVALCWTYEKSGNIWGPIVLHATINAIAMFL